MALVTDREIQRLRSLVRTFTKTNRILTGDRNINVSLFDNLNKKHVSGKPAHLRDAPGFTIYPDIYINFREFDNFKNARTIVQLLGLNYHELAHVLYTSRTYGTQLNSRQRTAYNILEDQRIESFFTAKYPPAGKYFTEMVVRFYVNQPETWAAVFPATYGRSFLPLEIREEFEARYAVPENIDRIKFLINKYKRFTARNFAANPPVAVDRIVKEFTQLLFEQEEDGHPLVNPDCADPNPNGGSPDQQDEQEARDKDRKRREKEERTGEDQSGFWEDEDDEDDESASEGAGEDTESDDDGPDDENAGDGDSGGGDSEDSESDDGGSGDSDDSADEDERGGTAGSDGSDEDTGDEDGDSGDSGEPASDSGSDTSGTGDSEVEPQFDDDELEDYFHDIIDAVNEDESVNQEVQQITAAMNDLGDIDVIDFDHTPAQLVPASPAEVQVSDAMIRDLRRLHAEVEPGWRYGSDVGRLNIGRAISDPENYEEMFDEWDEGREQEVGTEVFIAIDISWSMNGTEIEQASRALWLLKRSLDDVDAKTTVIGFSTATYGLLSRDQKVDRTQVPIWGAINGTNPAHTFHLARRVLNTSSMPNKLFVCITDGDWEAKNTENGTMENLSELIEQIPGTRLYISIGSGTDNLSAQRKFHARTVLNNPLEIGTVVRLAVNNMLNERRRRG